MLRKMFARILSHYWSPATFGIVWFVFWFWTMLGGMDRIFGVALLALLPMLIASAVLVSFSIVRNTNHTRQTSVRLIVYALLVWAIPLPVYFYERHHPFAVSENIRWITNSEYYKRQFKPAASVNGGLEHEEFDVEGPSFATITTYLVFDPNDSLSSAAKKDQPGKYNGLPCTVFEVRRLERNWYAVDFGPYSWDYCWEDDQRIIKSNPSLNH